MLLEYKIYFDIIKINMKDRIIKSDLGFININNKLIINKFHIYYIFCFYLNN